MSASASAMSAPLPSPFLSPVFSPFSPPLESNHHDNPFEQHHDTPSPSSSPSPSPRRKRDRVKSFVKHLASPFVSPSPSSAHLPPDSGSPSHPTISLSPGLESTPAILRKRASGSSVKNLMKNVPSPQHSPSPSSTPFPGTPDTPRLSPNLNPSSSPDVDPHGSPTRKRERVRSFVKSLRRTSSQLFKKDKKDAESKKSSSTISTLVADSLSVSTAATTPNILRRFSHSKHPSLGSLNTTDSDLSTSYLEVKVKDGGVSSPIIEVATPISPAVAEPVEPTPMSPLKETSNEGDQAMEIQPEVVQILPPSIGLAMPEADPELKGESASVESVDPIQFPLPPSPIPPPSHLAVPVDPIQAPVSRQEEDLVPHDDESFRVDTASRGDDLPLRGDSSTSESNTQEVSSSGEAQPSDTKEVTPNIPTPQTSDPSSLASPSCSSPGPDEDEADREMRDLCVPVLIPPMLFWPISNMRLHYFFTPVLTWWLSKGVLSYPYLYS